MTDFAASLTGDDDPYHVRQFPLDELDKTRRELQAGLILYPVGTAARQRLRTRSAAIDAEHARRAENGNVA